jgi:hypothetical protein
MAPSDLRRVRLRELRRLAEACRRVIRVGERVVKEFTSQLPCYDLTRIIIELHCPPDSDQEQGTSDKARDDSADAPKSQTAPQKS